MSPQAEYSTRLRRISNEQFQAMLDIFGLGDFQSAKPVGYKRDSHNVFVTSTKGEFVLRGSADYTGQFAREQFFARTIDEKTDVRAPWPYRLRASTDIFGWKGGFALMPSIPGQQLADPDVYARLSRDDRQGIAKLLGETLRKLQAAQLPAAGFYDYVTEDVVPFQSGFCEWFIGAANGVLGQALAAGVMSRQDHDDARQFIHDARTALSVPFQPTIVLNDYGEASIIATRTSIGWIVNGMTRFSEAYSADGEIDLVRPIARYIIGQDEPLAQAFLEGYGGAAAMRERAPQRLAAYMLADRLEVWLAARQAATAGADTRGVAPDTIEGSFSDYVHPFLDGLAKLLRG